MYRDTKGTRRSFRGAIGGRVWTVRQYKGTPTLEVGGIPNEYPLSTGPVKFLFNTEHGDTTRRTDGKNLYLIPGV